ncbi:hypothetical protein CDV31_017061 [Fusarium ambrosium]|uniref:Integral membrane protein n=1 Tax=Fusarium ambrosium TaxID=131363 RepID=A0A428RUE4_9HYPO|nr:hypothetical protein CDV31_017061 [Fusarium ambrosium]
MGRYGYLIPDTYVREVPSEVDMNISSIFWGFSLGVAVFSAAKAGKQSWRSWRRARRITVYVAMVWVVWFSSMAIGALAWGFQRQYIDPSFGFYFCVSLFWALQVQFLLLIISNRLSLLMVPERATKLRWFVLGIMLPISISVIIIWVPAQLQINDTWVYLNEIWDRCEKVIFAIIDGLLNCYFIYSIRSQLVENGLMKYTPLYRMNLFLVSVSLSLDVVLVGLIYLSFHPVCYLLKLQVEMNMAELIVKIVRSTGRYGHDEIYHVQSARDKPRTARGAIKVKSSNGLVNARGALETGNITHVGAGGQSDDMEMEIRGGGNSVGITKITQIMVSSSPVNTRDDDDSHSMANSTRRLNC